MEAGVQGPFDVARADLHGSFGPLAGSGLGFEGRTEAESGFESVVRSPAAAP